MWEKKYTEKNDTFIVFLYKDLNNNLCFAYIGEKNCKFLGSLL